MRSWRRNGSVLFGLALLLAPVAGAEPKAPGSTRVAVYRVLPRDHALTLPSKVGILGAGVSLTVSFEVSGRVERILGQGARVSEGGELAALESALEAAELRRAELLLQDAHAELARVRGLEQSRAASKSALDSAVTAVGLRRAERDAARERLERRTLTARFEGVLADVVVDPGEVTAPGAPIAELLNFDVMSLEVGIPGYQVGRVVPNARVEVSVPALPEQRFEGTVHLVAPSAANGGPLFEVEILVPNTEGILKPGMSARADIVTRVVSGAVVVPLDASVEREGRRVVFFVVDGRARAVDVGSSPLHGDRLILSVDVPSQDLVVRGHQDLRDGMAVRVDNAVLGGLDPEGRAAQRDVRAGVVAP